MTVEQSISETEARDEARAMVAVLIDRMGKVIDDHIPGMTSWTDANNTLIDCVKGARSPEILAPLEKRKKLAKENAR